MNFDGIITDLHDEDTEIKLQDFKNLGSFTPLFEKSLTFAYDFLNVHKVEEFCVCQASNPIELYHAYFEEVNFLATNTLNEIIQDSRFKIDYSPRGKQLEVYKELVGIADLKPEQKPIMGHFALWTRKASSPRVFFFLGPLNIVYILYFDFNHSTHLTDHRPS